MQKPFHTLKKHLLFITISCTLCYQSVLGENDTFIPIHIDGFNTFLFNQEYPNQSLNMHSIVYGNPLDQFPFDMLSNFEIQNISNPDSIQALKSDSLFRLQASAKMGAETGESMLNAFEGLGHENRDHFTIFATGCTFPKSPLNIFFGYRYVDNYSDRFDAQWKDYEKKTNQDMKFHEEGLAKEIVTGYSLTGPIAATNLKTISYKHWGASPYYFSPIFSTGYYLSPNLNFTLPKSKLYIDFVFDYHRDYYDHINFTEYTDEGWNITWQRQLRKGITAQFSHHKDSKLKPSSYVNATLHDTASNFFIWTLSGNLYRNFRLGGSLDISYIQIPKFSLDVNTGWNFIPKARSYTFRENKSSVEYHTMMYEVATLHTSLNYTDTLFFPIQASVWLNYCEKPLWETVDSINKNNIIIRQDTISNAAHLTFGGKGSYKISFYKFLITLWGNAAITPKDKELRFSLPLNVGTDIAFGKPDNDSLYAVIRIENRDRISLKYRNEKRNEIMEYTAPAQTSASFILKIPFHLPFLRKYIRTNLQIEAGPIRFLKEQRSVEHPRGNLIGPAISMGINGFIN